MMTVAEVTTHAKVALGLVVEVVVHLNRFVYGLHHVDLYI